MKAGFSFTVEHNYLIERFPARIDPGPGRCQRPAIVGHFAGAAADRRIVLYPNRLEIAAAQRVDRHHSGRFRNEALLAISDEALRAPFAVADAQPDGSDRPGRR